MGDLETMVDALVGYFAADVGVCELHMNQKEVWNFTVAFDEDNFVRSLVLLDRLTNNFRHFRLNWLKEWMLAYEWSMDDDGIRTGRCLRHTLDGTQLLLTHGMVTIDTRFDGARLGVEITNGTICVGLLDIGR